MGGVLTRPPPAGDEETGAAADAYLYPPKNGACYFGDNFLMGGEKFELAKPESFLFGDNADLHFVGHSPLEFALGNMQSPEPTRMLHCLVNVRRDSVRLVKRASSGAVDQPVYGVELVLDADAMCSVTVHQFATEIFAPGVPYRCESRSSSVYRMSAGCGQRMCTDDSFAFSPGDEPEDNLTLNRDGALALDEHTVFPIVIECTVQTARDTDHCAGTQTQATLCAVVRSAESGVYVLRVLKQKVVAAGVSYLLQEVYGIENKLAAGPPLDAATPNGGDSAEAGGGESAAGAQQEEDSRTDCVVCLCELRDTLILPCKHLCLCAACAETLRYKLGTCPICRAPFRALLHMRAMRRLKSTVSAPVIRAAMTVGKQSLASDAAGGANADAYLTTKYETVALIECLNGPVDQTQTCVTAVHASKCKQQVQAAPRPRRNRRRQHAPPRSAPIQPVFTAGEPSAGGGGTSAPVSGLCSDLRRANRPTSIIIDPDQLDGATSPPCTAGASSLTASARALDSATTVRSDARLVADEEVAESCM